MDNWIKYLSLFILLSTSQFVQAQREAATWYFGVKTGFDFSIGAPVPLNNSSRPVIGPAAVTLSDKQTGQLLFYSDAVRVWNRQHILMAHGDSLAGSYTIMQGCLAIPVPDQDQQYYLFTLKATSGAAQLYYSLLDMSLSNGLGDVVNEKKNKLISDNLNYQLTAIPHANKRDYWLVTRRWNSNTFCVYLIDINGVTLASQQSIGPVQSQLGDTEGFLKASPNGKKLAYATSGNLPISLFDFDTTTGSLSHYINLGRLLAAGGLSFSPDNSKLYIQNYSLLPGQGPNGNLRNIISQFDLATGSDVGIASSGISVIANNPNTNIRADYQGSSGFYAMQLGLDGRLYGNSDYAVDNSPPVLGQENLYVISAPNKRGFACDIKYKPFSFGNGQASPGFPNFLESYFNNLSSPPADSSQCDFTSVKIFPNPISDTFKVQFLNACSDSYTLSIYNVLGQIVYSQAINNGVSNPIAISQLASGVYIIEIQVAGKSLRTKIIKNSY